MGSVPLISIGTGFLEQAACTLGIRGRSRDIDDRIFGQLDRSHHFRRAVKAIVPCCISIHLDMLLRSLLSILHFTRFDKTSLLETQIENSIDMLPPS